jgi:hypothetical protein
MNEPFYSWSWRPLKICGKHATTTIHECKATKTNANATWTHRSATTSLLLFMLPYSANAEYIRMGDVIIDVPGGSNNHNYANVTLIGRVFMASMLYGQDGGMPRKILPFQIPCPNPILPFNSLGPPVHQCEHWGTRLGPPLLHNRRVYHV